MAGDGQITAGAVVVAGLAPSPRPGTLTEVPGGEVVLRRSGRAAGLTG
jgi:hypothetical protein